MSQDKLFDHMAETHGLMLLESELNDIRHSVTGGAEEELQAARAEVDSGRKRIAELEAAIKKKHELFMECIRLGEAKRKRVSELEEDLTRLQGFVRLIAELPIADGLHGVATYVMREQIEHAKQALKGVGQ